MKAVDTSGDVTNLGQTVPPCALFPRLSAATLNLLYLQDTPLENEANNPTVQVDGKIRLDDAFKELCTLKTYKWVQT